MIKKTVYLNGTGTVKFKNTDATIGVILMNDLYDNNIVEKEMDFKDFKNQFTIKTEKRFEIGTEPSVVGVLKNPKKVDLEKLTFKDYDNMDEMYLYILKNEDDAILIYTNKFIFKFGQSNTVYTL